MLLLFHFRLRGKVVLKGRRPVGATDDYDTDDDAADDDMTELQSIWTEKTSISSVSLKQSKHVCDFIMCIYVSPLTIPSHHTRKS